MNYKLNEFALLSLGRCGTTMFQNMINSHSELYLSDECHWMRGMSEPGLQYHRFAEVDDINVNKIPDDSKWWDALKALNSSLIIDKQDKKCGLQYIGQTNLNNIAPLYKTYPQLPSIILIRDPRSLLHSLYRTGIGYPLQQMT
ncbi:sulfotransferase [Paraglaciecola sp. Hal342]